MIIKTLFIALILLMSPNVYANFYYYDATDLKFEPGENVDTDLGFKTAVGRYVIFAKSDFANGDILLLHGPNQAWGLRFWVKPPGQWVKTEWEDPYVQEQSQSVVILRQAGQNLDGTPIVTTGGGTNDDIPCLLPVPECNEEQEPLIIDLGQDGIHLGAPGIGIEFDFFGDGSKVATQWVAPYGNEAFLALDANQNGQIDNGSELFGRGILIGSDTRARHGFEELAQYDIIFNGGNFDGVIDQQDAVWQKLLLWNDLNADGISTPDELTPLHQSDITELQLNAKENARLDPAGNALRFWAWANANNVTGDNKFKMVDVFFAPLKH